MASELVARPLSEIESLCLNDLTGADLAAVVRHGGVKTLSADTALKELVVRAWHMRERERREDRIGRLAIELFKELKNG